MRQWLCNIICRSKGAALAVAERANHDSYDFETKIRDLRRRIEEQKQAVGYYNTTQRRTVVQHEEVAQPIPDVERAQKNAELDDIRNKLRSKKK